MDVRTYEIDGTKYFLLNQVIENDTKYVYLSTFDGKKQMIQKIFLKNPELIHMLDNRKEVEHALELFNNKISGDDK